MWIRRQAGKGGKVRESPQCENEEDKDNINKDNKEDGTENGEKQSQGELTPEEGKKSPSSDEQSGEVARNNEEKKDKKEEYRFY